VAVLVLISLIIFLGGVELMVMGRYLKNLSLKYIVMTFLVGLLCFTILAHYYSLQKSTNISRFYTPTIVDVNQLNSNITFVRLWLEAHQPNHQEPPTKLGLVFYHLDKSKNVLFSIGERLTTSRLVGADQKILLQERLNLLTDSFNSIDSLLLGLKNANLHIIDFNSLMPIFDDFFISSQSFETELYDEMKISMEALRYEIITVFIGLILLFMTTIPIFIKHQKIINIDRELLSEKEKQMKVSQQQLEYVIQAADLGYWDWEFETGYHIVNDRWLSMLGCTRADIHNDLTDWSDRIHSEDKDRVIDIVQTHIKSATPYTTDFRMKHKEGHWVWIQGSGAVVEYHPDTRQPVRLCGTHQDVSSRKAFEIKLLQQATHDHLTELMNRVEMEKTFEREFLRSIRYHHQLSVFMVDVDYFKTINDTYGHSMGDKVLKIIASTIKATMRKIDIVARYGGEEFVVILPETSLQIATTLAKRLRMTIQDLEIEGIHNITISIGIDSLTEATNNCYELLNNADHALYAAKDLGRNQVVRFVPEQVGRLQGAGVNRVS
jgi:diguanylate cyclase (GGDEF)-like protein/PAS domain S-box-containing protein